MVVTPSAKTTFELVSPERLLLSQAVDMVVVPGAEGLFAALIGHAPFIAQLRPGVIAAGQFQDLHGPRQPAREIVVRRRHGGGIDRGR